MVEKDYSRTPLPLQIRHVILRLLAQVMQSSSAFCSFVQFLQSGQTIFLFFLPLQLGQFTTSASTSSSPNLFSSLFSSTYARAAQLPHFDTYSISIIAHV